MFASRKSSEDGPRMGPERDADSLGDGEPDVLRKAIASPIDDEAVVAHVATLVQLCQLRHQAHDARGDPLGLSLGAVRHKDDRTYLKHVAEILADLRRVRVDGASLVAMWECVQDLLGHRSGDARALAFDFIDTCLDLHADRAPMALRTSIFRALLQGHGDYIRRQKSLRRVLQDGRLVGPFAADLGPYLLQLLRESDAQKDLLSLLHCIVRRSPHALSLDVITEFAVTLAAQSDVAWTRGDTEVGERFLMFASKLVAHKLDRAASAPACLQTICGLANSLADLTWGVIKKLLLGPSRHHTLHGLLDLLETKATSPYVQRGAIYFLAMSCWGWKRITELEFGWATILHSHRRALESHHVVVVQEVVVSLLRLVKKYGDQLLVEWRIIFDCLYALQPWVLSADRPMEIRTNLLETLVLIDKLVDAHQFQGDIDAFLDVAQVYLTQCPESLLLRLVAHRGAACHPVTHPQWSSHLADVLAHFYHAMSVPSPVRLAALHVLFDTLDASRFLCEDRVLEEFLLPALECVYDDPSPDVRRSGLDQLARVAEHVETTKFHALVDILHNAVVASKSTDAQEIGVSAIVRLFEMCFLHAPPVRAVRTYELLTGYCATHRHVAVRRIAVECLLRLSTANASYQMQLVLPNEPKSHGSWLAKAVVALLSLASTETHTDVLELAIAALRKMLENRFVLRDVNLSDMALKLVSCVECRAFGRAAIAHGLAADVSPSAWRCAAATYLDRGFELLLLFGSTDAQLNAAAQRRLFLTFVHGLDLRPSVAAWPAHGVATAPDVALQAAERALAHTVTSGLGTLLLLMPDDVESVLPAIVDALVQRTCTTDGGSWVPDLVCMGLELLLNLFRANRAAALPEVQSHAILLFALRGLHLPSAPKRIVYSAYMVLAHCFACAPVALRGALAHAAGPLLSGPDAHVLDEVAMDYIKSIAFAPAKPEPPSRLLPAPRQVSWSFQNTIVTVRTGLGITQVVVRRATGTQRYRLDTSPMEEAHPLHIMSHLFDINPLVQHQLSGLDELIDGDGLTRALSVLDLSPPYETHKIGVLYIARGKANEKDVLSVVGGSPRYVSFLRGLGRIVRMDAIDGYNGGLDTSPSSSDGAYGLVYRDSCMQVVFHVPTMMHGPLSEPIVDVASPPSSSWSREDSDGRRHSKKRHLGNDFVHIVYVDDVLSNDVSDEPVVSGHFTDVRIVVQPLDERPSFYRVRVLCKQDGLVFGPLSGTQIVPAVCVAEAVRLTALNASLACRAIHHDRIEFVLNAEDRLKQIKLIDQRWKVRAS
ncbi:hypothetical protein SPRG_10646 [Saprolegnia parasitica CBS 223.65]|uniref:Rap-GAP domain-containing protein n=1 Tax=Saprolegnia parasitica (strain CBS 223.65) TaxID=695850 RepID=A0A067C480_SAPPC|nr:hypothetical protein SPRG_10646 [Saprolegnia parasitica CBS 223.65]KDO23950.1 hypothetical protein SPRG_10646 [Saprolegnia parasitica CBS 223.65]|eukprot:XP_012205272.1 hypothetical protein SPRG_10646 [Saprolegnia parasitica CBS 223.65]